MIATTLIRTKVWMNFMVRFDVVGMAFSLLLASLAWVLVHIEVWQKTPVIFIGETTGR